jgi:uncharacterized delta-60 repeat protein
LVGLQRNGYTDNSFGEYGRVKDPDGGYILTSLVVQPDNKIIAAGNKGGDFAITRYNADGSRDTSFSGGDGTLTIDFGASDIAWDIALQSDGKLVAVGLDHAEIGGIFDDQFAVARVNRDGTLDKSFDGMAN